VWDLQKDSKNVHPFLIPTFVSLHCNKLEIIGEEKKVLISMFSHENFSLVSNLEHSYRYRFTIFHICCALALKTSMQKNNNKLCVDESRKQNTNKNQEMKKFYFPDERIFFSYTKICYCGISHTAASDF
jgi:hypothetical protein